MYIGIAWTRLRLVAWGHYNRLGLPTYPSECPYLRQTVGHGHESNPPEDVQEIDSIVARAEPKDKLIIVVAYAQGGSMRDKAQRLHLAKTTYARHLDRAEWYVHQSLDYVGQDAVKNTQTRIAAHV